MLWFLRLHWNCILVENSRRVSPQLLNAKGWTRCYCKEKNCALTMISIKIPWVFRACCKIMMWLSWPMESHVKLVIYIIMKSCQRCQHGWADMKEAFIGQNFLSCICTTWYMIITLHSIPLDSSFNFIHKYNDKVSKRFAFLLDVNWKPNCLELLETYKIPSQWKIKEVSTILDFQGSNIEIYIYEYIYILYIYLCILIYT